MRTTYRLKPLSLLLLTAVFLLSCQHNTETREYKAGHADSVLFNVGARLDYKRMLQLADSFEMVGDISPLDANRWRGVAYYRQGNYHMSEICYRKALESEVKTEADQLSYNKSARRLSELLLVKGDFEGSLRVAIPAVAKMDKTGVGSDIDYAILLNNIGCCQLNLGRDEEANESFLIAREHYANRWKTDSTSRGLQEAVIGTIYTSLAYINMRRYSESIYWIDRTEMLLDKTKMKADARSEYFDEYQGRIEIMRAVALQGLHKTSEAALAYYRFQKTNYSKTAAGRINANDYLVAAERYAEAADNYRYLDETLSQRGMQMSLDNIQLYMLPKFKANAEAGRRDSARVAAVRIMEVLDDAITDQKNSTTAQLATIYDTQGKETELAQQQAKMSRQRLVAAAILMTLVLIFLTIYILNKRKSTHHLREAHEKLQHAYDQLEETTAAKERIESELRIARDIQQAIVPRTFPNHDGVDLYAYMKPAKEVGGDLYDYLLQDDQLYICLGDVSGKGIPAALFMTQAVRLFRAIAKQHHSPATIATRINNELSENNEQGMFVTMFIGRITLSTGQLDFCNAGHNPPLLGHDFLEMQETNAPIGLWPGLEFVGEKVDNIKGKLLFVYSDGLNEAENQEQQQFGDDRLVEIVRNMTTEPVQTIIEHLTAEVENHRNGAAPNDDLTMMGMRIS